MADITSFAQASQAFAEIRQHLAGDEGIAAVRSYAADNADLYRSLLNNERYAQFDGAVRSAMSVAEDAVRVPIQQAVNTVTYAVGSQPTSISATVDSDMVRSSVPANASVPTSREPGHATYSTYLNSHQEQMTAENAKDVDYNILSELSYTAKWSKSDEYAKATQREGITVREYCNGLLEHLDDTPENMQRRNYLKEMAESDRFSGLTIDHALGNIGSGGGSQTQVLVIGTGNGHAVMAVQGTDGTLKDWGNNGRFAGSDPIQEEQWVTSVLNRYASDYTSFDLTGHSQGGREAVTAAMFMDDENRDRIRRVVSNDGPGYSDAFLEKHTDQVRQIEGKVLNVRPDGSYVGRLLTGIGEVKTVESTSIITGYKDGKAKHTVIHEGTCWYVDESGNYIEPRITGLGIAYDAEQLIKQGYSELIQDTTPVLARFLSTYMPEDRVDYYLEGVFNLFDGGNGDVDFGSFNSDAAKELGKEFIEEFKADMDKLNREQLTDFEYSTLIVCEAFNDFYSEVDEWLTYAEIFCYGMSLALSETVVGGAFFLALGEAIETVHEALRIGDYICKGIRIILNVTAYLRAAEKKKARDAYIGNHPDIIVHSQYLLDAASHLSRVATCLGEANESYSAMLNHFKNRVRKLATDAAQTFVGENEWVESISNVSRNDAAGYCLLHGVKRIGSAGINRVSKGAATIQDIADKTDRVLAEASLPASPFFRVTPSKLSQAGADGSARADMIEVQKKKVDGMIGSLKGQYVGEDADSLNSKWANEYVVELEKLVETYRTLFDNLQTIAGIYSRYQNDTIEAFQNMRLGLGLFD